VGPFTTHKTSLIVYNILWRIIYTYIYLSLSFWVLGGRGLDWSGLGKGPVSSCGKAVVTFRMPKIAGNFFTSWGTKISRRTLLHGVNELVSQSENFFLWRVPQQMLRTHRSLKAYCATLCWSWLVFFIFPCNGATVEWNWQGKTEVLGEKPIPVPLCQPQILHGLTRARTQTRGERPATNLS
jgi:hypothetical protein